MKTANKMLLIVMALIIIMPMVSATWWDNSWSKAKSISINTTDATSRANVSVLINVTYDSDMLSNFSDLRFLDAEQDDELYYWFYNNTYVASNAVQVWVKLNRNISTASNATIYMYYGNPNADTKSNVELAGLFGDDFNSTSLDFTNDWQASATTKFANKNIVENGMTILNVSVSNDNVQLNTANAYSDFIMEMRMYTSQWTGSNGWYIESRSTQGNWGAGGDNQWLEGNSPVKYCTGGAVNCSSGGSTAASVWGRSIMKLPLGDNGNWTYLTNDGATYNFGRTYNASVRTPYLAINPYGTASTLRQIDWIFYRRYVAVEPTNSFGSEQSNDENYPVFTSEQKTSNNTVYSLNGNYQFNITIQYTNATAGISFNSINYSMTNVSTLFTKTLTNLAAGTYPYYFWAYGNGSLHLYNKTVLSYYTVSKAQGLVYTYINSSRENSTALNNSLLNLSAQLVSGAGTVKLYINNTVINSGSSFISNLTNIQVGNWIIKGNYSGNENYTAAQESWNLTVIFGNAVSITTVSTSPPSPIDYGTASNWSCSNNQGLSTEMFVNGLNYTDQKGLSVVRSAGSYSINCSSVTNENLNITGSSQVSTYTINKAAAVLSLIASPSNDEDYGTETTVTGSGCDAQLTCNLNRNGAVVGNPNVATLNAGTYVYNYSTSGNENYSAGSSNLTLTINKLTPSLSLSISPSNTITNGTQTTATAAGCPDATCLLRRNGVLVTNPETTTFAVGTYVYNYSFAGSTNYNAISVTSTLTVNPILFAGTNGSINFLGGNLSQALGFQVPFRFVTQAYMNLSGYIGNNTVVCYGSCSYQFTDYNFSTVYTPATSTTNTTYLNYSYVSSNSYLIKGNKGLASSTNSNYQYYNYTSGTYTNIPLSSFQDFGDDVDCSTYNATATLPSDSNYATGGLSIKLISSTGNGFGVGCKGNVIFYDHGLNNITNAQSYPTNLNVSLNSSQIYYHPNSFNQTNNRTQNFYNILNNYLSTCTYTSNYCIVPITFNSSTSGILNYSNVLFSNEGFIELNQNYSNSTIETESKNYSMNIAYDNSTYTPTAWLVFNGTEYSATVNISGTNATISRTLLTPVGTGTKTLYWKIAMSNSTSTNYYNSTSSNITVNLLNMSLLASPYTPVYINFTFHNETTLGESVSATFNAQFTYYISDPSVNKTFSYVSSSETSQYKFSFTPNTTAVYLYSTGTYDNAESQQRSFSNLSYINNVSTVRDLLLLPNSQGTYISFIIQSQTLARISGALISITKTSDGSPVEQKLSDGTGIAAFWLDSNTNYGITITASGYNIYSTSLTPSTSPVTYTLTPTTSSSGGGNQRGISKTITPAQNKLNNNTEYDFVFTISSGSLDLDEYGFSLWNSTTQLSTAQTGTTSTGGTETVTFDTGSQSYIVMNWYYVVDGDYTNGTRKWFVVNTDGTGNSIANFFDDVNGFIGNETEGILGLKKGTTGGNFSLAIIIFLITFVFAGVMTYKFGVTSTTAVMFAIFSIILFFDVGAGLLPNPVDAVPHFISILFGVVAIGFFIRETTI